MDNKYLSVLTGPYSRARQRAWRGAVNREQVFGAAAFAAQASGGSAREAVDAAWGERPILETGVLHLSVSVARRLTREGRPMRELVSSIHVCLLASRGLRACRPSGGDAPVPRNSGAVA